MRKNESAFVLKELEKRGITEDNWPDHLPGMSDEEVLEMLINDARGPKWKDALRASRAQL